MISEPEMSHEPGGDLPGDLLSGSTDPAAAATAGRRPRPWLWALGGAAAASAAWAGVLHGAGGTAPDLHGYRVSGNPCGDGSLDSLKDAMRGQDFVASDAAVSKGPALDRLSCFLSSTTGDGGWVVGYTVSVGVELHKKTDPRAEFDNARHSRVSTLSGGAGAGSVTTAVSGTDFVSTADVRPVTGVGDEGYLLAPRGADQTLEVRHGGAVFTLQVSGYTQWNGSDETPVGSDTAPQDPDLTRLRPAMTAAMRALMASLAS